MSATVAAGYVRDAGDERTAWEAGVVLCGLSAGSLCWFAEAMTGYHGASRPVEGIGLIPASNAVTVPSLKPA